MRGVKRIRNRHGKIVDDHYKMNTIIGIFKTYINDNNLDALKDYLLELKETEYEPPISWDYLFQKVYIHACLKKKRAIVDFLMEQYAGLTPIEQIAVRQVFSYGRHLLEK